MDTAIENAKSASLTSLAPLYAALAKAQGEFGPIMRTRTVQVRSEKGNYTFDYAPLDVVMDAIVPALSKNGLAITWRTETEGGDVSVETVMTHSSGVCISSRMAWKLPGRIQELGSLVTYMRRYGVMCLTGVVAEEDDDGNAADGNQRDVSRRGPKAAAKSDGPAPSTLTDETRRNIEDAAKRLKALGRLAAIAKEVTGKADPNDMTEADGDKLYRHLLDMIAAESKGGAK